MKISHSFVYNTNQEINSEEGRKITSSHSNSRTVELDFLKLGIMIVLIIIALELVNKSIVIPAFVWVLVELVLFMYVVYLIVSTAILLKLTAIYVSAEKKNFRNEEDEKE